MHKKTKKGKKTKKSKKKKGSLIKKQNIVHVLKPKEKIIKEDLEEEIEVAENKHMLEELRNFISPRSSHVISTGLEQVAPIRDLEGDLGNIPVEKDNEDNKGVLYSQDSQDATKSAYIGTGGIDTQTTEKSYELSNSNVVQMTPSGNERGFQSPEFSMLENKKGGKDDYSPKQYVDKGTEEREKESKRLPFQKKRDKF